MSLFHVLERIYSGHSISWLISNYWQGIGQRGQESVKTQSLPLSDFSLLKCVTPNIIKEIVEIPPPHPFIEIASNSPLEEIKMKIRPSELKKFTSRFAIKPGVEVDLKKDFDPGDTAGYEKPENAAELLHDGVEFLAAYQEKLYAENTRGLLVV